MVLLACYDDDNNNNCNNNNKNNSIISAALACYDDNNNNNNNHNDIDNNNIRINKNQLDGIWVGFWTRKRTKPKLESPKHPASTRKIIPQLVQSGLGHHVWLAGAHTSDRGPVPPVRPTALVGKILLAD